MTTPKHRILVVDDDLRLRTMLKSYLNDQGFACDTAQDAQAMTQNMVRMRYDLIVLDVMMPGEDGLTACKRLRANGDLTPVIMLTAKDEEGDRIVGLDIGADDYMGKPFNPQELVSRVNAVLRRQAPLPVPGAPTGDEIIVRFGEFELNLGKRTLTKQGACHYRVTNSQSLLVGASSKHLIDRLMCKCRAFASFWKLTVQGRNTYKQCGVWVMYLFRISEIG
jgi:two-component system, OmpR family, phosphate regulon response regulator OmpR